VCAGLCNTTIIDIFNASLTSTTVTHETVPKEKIIIGYLQGVLQPNVVFNTSLMAKLVLSVVLNVT